VTEWYVNGPLGLEQGFTLESAPGERTGAPLSLALTLWGDLQAALEPGGNALRLNQADGTVVLRYRGLHAQDATGRALRSWLQVQKGQLWLRVDDDGAQYPIVVDPFVEQVKLTATDAGSGGQFDTSVAINGDTVVVGAYTKGAAYVFVKPAGGWAATTTFAAKLTTTDAGSGDQFGISVALTCSQPDQVCGDTVVVGANIKGAVYVFVKNGGWATTNLHNAKLTITDVQMGDQPEFGYAVAVSGDTVVVGADGDDSNKGAA
jgi:hypothetical protein